MALSHKPNLVDKQTALQACDEFIASLALTAPDFPEFSQMWSEKKDLISNLDDHCFSGSFEEFEVNSLDDLDGEIALREIVYNIESFNGLLQPEEATQYARELIDAAGMIGESLNNDDTLYFPLKINLDTGTVKNIILTLMNLPRMVTKQEALNIITNTMFGARRDDDSILLENQTQSYKDISSCPDEFFQDGFSSFSCDSLYEYELKIYLRHLAYNQAFKDGMITERMEKRCITILYSIDEIFYEQVDFNQSGTISVDIDKLAIANL